VHASVDAFTADERFDNEWSSQLTIRQVGAKTPPRQVPMRQVAPGRYAADFDLDGFGSFLLRADHARREDDGSLRPVGVSFAHVSNPYPREYASFEPDLERLGRAVRAGGGVLDPAPRALFEPQGEKIVHHAELYGRFLYAACGAFLLDLLLRRVRLFDRKRVANRPRSSLRPRAA
jgi:Ca-activated chloride channel family protein